MENENIIKSVLRTDKLNEKSVYRISTGLYKVDFDGMEYIFYFKTEGCELDELVELYELNVDTIFVLVYKTMECYENDRAMNSENNKKIETIRNSALKKFVGNKMISLFMDSEGENYLEYESSIDIKVDSIICNLKLYELTKLYQADGDNLFNENVRIGIQSKPKENEVLRRSFLEALAKGIIYHIRADEINNDVEGFDAEDEFLLWINRTFDFAIDTKEDNEDPQLSKFWYKHNGITIVEAEPDAIIINANEIVFNAESIQIINGAQTITLWNDIFYHLDRMNNDNISLYNSIKNIIKKAKNEIWVRTCLLKYKDGIEVIAKGKFTSDVTLGLNTQIPVTQVDIFIKSEQEVNELNKVLFIYGIEIGKHGQIYDNIKILSIKGLIQNYLIFIGQPGLARNLPISYILTKDNIAEIKRFFIDSKDEAHDLVAFIRLQHDIDKWWRSRADIGKNKINIKYKETIYSDEVGIISSNALSLFKSYLVYQDYIEYMQNPEFDLHISLETYYEQFLKDFIDKIIDNKKIMEELGELSSNSFKGKDKLVYSNLVVEKKNQIDMNELNTAFIKYKLGLGESIPKAYKYLFIEKWLMQQEINLENVRTITRIDGKTKESFPFNEFTFSDISIKVNNEEKPKLDFKKSNFYAEICKEYNLFVFEDIEIDTEICTKIEMYIVDFKKYEKDAKIVYDKVIEAFNLGDESDFPKESEGLSFHIRPKAQNAKDIIQFYDDKYITRRTFWANKSVMDDIVETTPI